MDFLTRLEDCYDEADGKEPSSILKTREDIYQRKQLMLDLLDERISYLVENFDLTPVFIPSNEEFKIQLPVPTIGL